MLAFCTALVALRITLASLCFHMIYNERYRFFAINKLHRTSKNVHILLEIECSYYY